MEPESLAVIDVEVEPIDNPEPEDEETWYSAVQIQGLLKLSKAGLQQSISKLQSIYGLDIATLRRGAARATQYSELALKACKLLNAGKLSELRKLVEAAPAAPSPLIAGGLAISEYTPALDRRITQLNQNANSASASLNQNVQQLLAQIASENEAAQQRDSDLKQARINAAQNRGAAQALEIYQAEQKALNEVLAQLRARQLGGAE
ncbi:hypothetical protein NDI43_27520 [Microcoleus vaginatus GB2-A3]|uniref:hypothetical protein n=1 Tax=Microcoleus vaginatus TaxID=119532 RepID=UPI0032A1667C